MAHRRGVATQHASCAVLQLTSVLPSPESRPWKARSYDPPSRHRACEQHTSDDTYADYPRSTESSAPISKEGGCTDARTSPYQGSNTLYASNSSRSGR